MDQRIIALYDDFIHRHFDRRLFLEQAARVAGGLVAAKALLPLLQSDYARAAIVSPDDQRLATASQSLPGASGVLKAYLAQPNTLIQTKAGGRRGGILVVHQNRGLNPHIEDVARRLALEGYNALAVDFLSPLGGTPPDEEAAMKLFPQLDHDQVTADAKAAVAWLRMRPDSNGKVGAIGFCWGGGVVNQLAAADPTLNAAVVYYGAPPAPAAVPRIKAPLLLNYADPQLDTRLGALLPPYEEALKAAHVNYRLYIYPGANHAFNDDTQTARYDAAAAKRAWERSLALFKETL